MNVSELFFDGMTRSDVEHAFATLNKLKKTFERIAGRIRPMSYLVAVIERANLTTFEGVAKLGAHVKTDWSCREIDFFSSFLHGGRFEPASGKWRREMAGMTFDTSSEDSNLERLWRSLLMNVHAYIGAAAVLDLCGARVVPGLMMTDEGDGPTLWDMTLDELVSVVPKERRKRLDVIAKFEEQRLTLERLERKMDMKDRRRSDYAVSARNLSQMLEIKNVKRGVRTIQLWEKYLLTGGQQGTKPPEGYNLDVRLTLASASAWVESFANLENGKLNTRCSFEKVQHLIGR